MSAAAREVRLPGYRVELTRALGHDGHALGVVAWMAQRLVSSKRPTR